MLGVAFEEIDLRDAKGEVQLHPCVALHDCGPLNADRFRINLGAEPFKFDIFPYLLQKTVLPAPGTKLRVRLALLFINRLSRMSVRPQLFVLDLIIQLTTACRCGQPTACSPRRRW